MTVLLYPGSWYAKIARERAAQAQRAIESTGEGQPIPVVQGAGMDHQKDQKAQKAQKVQKG
jgi:hypothetical protein